MNTSLKSSIKGKVSFFFLNGEGDRGRAGLKSVPRISVGLSPDAEAAADNGGLHIDSSSTDSPRVSESALHPCNLFPWRKGGRGAAFASNAPF